MAFCGKCKALGLRASDFLAWFTDLGFRASGVMA